MEASTTALLYLNGINVSFDGFRALNNLTLYINVGELRCIIGPNGAAPSTIARCRRRRAAAAVSPRRTGRRA